jgi:hypothetical protein
MSPKGLNLLRVAVVVFLAAAVLLIFWVARWEAATVIVGSAVLVLVLMVSFHARRTEYTCPACARKFAVSAWVDFLSPHVPHAKLLCCPDCRKVSWCEAGRIK